MYSNFLYTNMMMCLVCLTFTAYKLYSHTGVTIPWLYLNLHKSRLYRTRQVNVLHSVRVGISFEYLWINIYIDARKR